MSLAPSAHRAGARTASRARSAGKRGASGRVSARMRAALHAEWTKLRTVAATFWLLAAAIAVAGSVLAGRLILPGHGFTAARGFPVLSPGDGPVLRAAAGSVLYLALIALLSLGIAVIIRDSAAAIGVVLGLLYLPPLIAAVLASNPGMAAPDRAVRADECRADHPGHHRPAQPAHQPMVRPRRPRSLGRGRAAHRRADAPVA